MGLSSTISNISPIITLILGFLILKEKIAKIEIFNIIVSFIGVILLVIFSNRPSNHAFGSEISTSKYIFAIVCLFIGSSFSSFMAIVVRKLKTVHYSIINTVYGYYLTIVSFVIWYINY